MLYTKNALGTTMNLPRDHPAFGKVTDARSKRYPQSLKVTFHPILLSTITIPWHDVVQVSIDNVTWWSVDPLQTVVDEPHELPDDIGVDLTVHMAIGAGGLGSQTSSATVWGLATVSAHQHGLIAGKAGIVYLGPDLYLPLMQSIRNIGVMTFVRTSAKTIEGILYAIDAPVFGTAGLLISEVTSQDVPTILMPAATVRSIACRIKVYGSPTGTVTIWTATKNKLTINLTAATLLWTDDTTTVSCVFPKTAYLAGTAVTVVAMEDTSHAVTLACQADGGAWTTASGTLAAILWTNILTFGNLKGWLAHLVQWPYVLDHAEYEAIHFPEGPLTWNGVSIAHKQAGTLTLDEHGVLWDAAGTDYSGLVAGALTLPAGGTAVDITQTGGLSSRWYATVRDASI
jgi:hypothetical protein